MENVDRIKLWVQGNGSRVAGIVGHLKVCEKNRTQRAGYVRTELEGNLQRDGGNRPALQLRDTVWTGLQRKHRQYWRGNGDVALYKSCRDTRKFFRQRQTAGLYFLGNVSHPRHLDRNHLARRHRYRRECVVPAAHHERTALGE